MAELLLKARPTPVQLADRLRKPRPDGLELYLDAADMADESAMSSVLRALDAAALPSRFTLLIEGPVRSLDGHFFETSRNADADRELVRRLVTLGRRIGARAINLHLIRPRADIDELTLEGRAEELQACLPFARYFAEQACAADIVPTLENMPPVLRMQESGFYYSVVGMPAEDLTWIADRVTNLRLCLDLSHAQLYVNACAQARRARPPGRFRHFLRFVRLLPDAASVCDYAGRLGDAVVTSQVANAHGMLGEGRSYEKGDLDLDTVLPHLASRVSYFVTETLERRPERASLMRDALRRMRAALRERQPASVIAPG